MSRHDTAIAVDRDQAAEISRLAEARKVSKAVVLAEMISYCLKNPGWKQAAPTSASRGGASA